MRIVLAGLIVAGFSGCATTQKNSSEHLQSRVVELEKKLEEKDSEIVDLQYEVKDLSNKLGSTRESAPIEIEEVRSVPASSGGSDIIKASTTPTKLQTALKSAGFYTGKIDGKIGPGTKAAVVAFQRSKGLTADGVVGRKTWDALKQYL